MARTNGIAAADAPRWRKWTRGEFLPVATLLLAAFAVLAPFVLPSGIGTTHSQIQWDALEYHYPQLVFASDSIRHAHQLPLWNPFQDLGFPYVIDPQTQLWSPLTWLVIGLHGYSLKAVQFQFVCIILLAGLGAYAAARSIGITRWPSWIAGFSYMFCGYFVFSSSLLGTISSMAYFPWALMCLSRAVRSPLPTALGWISGAAFFLAQASVGGHPSTALVGAVNFAVLLLLWPRSRHRLSIRFLLLLIAGLLALLMSFPQVAGTQWLREILPSLTHNAYPLQYSERDPLMMRGLLAFILPGLPYFQSSFHSGTHPVLLGSYFGILPLIGIPLALRLRWKRRLPFLFGLAALANLLAALGPATLVRQVLYYTIPGLKLPHHAAMDFRGYAILYALLTAAFGWSVLIAAVRARHEMLISIRRALLVPAAILLLIALGCLTMDSMGGTTSPSPYALPSGEKLIGPSVLAEYFLAQAVLAALLAMILFKHTIGLRRLAPTLAIALFAFFDMSCSVKQSWTFFGAVVDMLPAEKRFNLDTRRPFGFHPDQFTNLGFRAKAIEGNILHQVETNGYNPISILHRSESAGSIEQLQQTYPHLWARRTAFVRANGEISADIPTLTEFSPNHMSFHVVAPESGTLQILSTWTPGWYLRLGNAEPIALEEPSDPHVLTLALPPGEHRIDLDFRPQWVQPALAAMAVGYGAVALLMAFPLLAAGKRRRNGPHS